MALRDIGVRAVVDNIGGFTRDMGRYTDAIDKAEKRTAKFSERVGKLGRALVGISAPLIAIGVLSTRAAISFETAFIGVRKTVDATEEEFADLEAAIRQMAQTIPISVEQFSQLAETAGQLGIRIADIQAFIRVVADLGVATTLSADQAAISLARLVTITGLAQSDFGRLGATIVDLGNNFAATEGEILSFGLRIASAGEIAGLTEAEILSIATAMSAVGIQAEAGGTAVQKVLLEMTQAVATSSQKLAVFAETADLSAQEFGSLFEENAGQAFTRFVEGLGRAGDKAFVILAELGLQDQRLLRSFLSLAAAGDTLSRSMELGTAAFAANTALVEEAEKRYASAASKITVARNRFNEFFITVGASLVPVLLKFLEVLAPIITTLGDLAGRFPIVTLGVVGLSLVIGGLGVALLALSFILPGLVVLFPALAGGISIAAIATGALAIALSPITLIIFGIVAAVAAVVIVWKNWSTIIDALKANLNDITGTLRTIARIGLALVAPITLIPGLDLPGFAHGGTSAGGLATVGERGPEVVNLPPGATVTPVSRTTSFNVEAHYTNPQSPASIRLDLETLAMMAGR